MISMKKLVKSLVGNMIGGIIGVGLVLGFFYLLGLVMAWAEQHFVLFLIISGIILTKLTLDEINK